jgi:hypothetical protein
LFYEECRGNCFDRNAFLNSIFFIVSIFFVHKVNRAATCTAAQPSPDRNGMRMLKNLFGLIVVKEMAVTVYLLLPL